MPVPCRLDLDKLKKAPGGIFLVAATRQFVVISVQIDWKWAAHVTRKVTDSITLDWKLENWSLNDLMKLAAFQKCEVNPVGPWQQNAALPAVFHDFFTERRLPIGMCVYIVWM